MIQTYSTSENASLGRKGDGIRVSEADKKRRPHSAKGLARYANYFRVGHNPYEFLLEFGQQDSAIHTSIYLSPQHAKMLSDLLLDALREYSLQTAPKTTEGQVQ
jgi:Protein of unknown function (DUF3467)